LHPEGM